MAETFLLDAIDALLFSESESMLSETEVDALQCEWSSAFMEQHARSGSPYLEWVERRNAMGARSPADIPLVPTSIFKSMNLLSIEDNMVEQWCISSGTQGATSRVGRDRATLDRLIGSLRYGLLMLPQHYEEELEIVHLGPSHADAGDIWFPYVMSLTELLYPTRSYMLGSQLLLADALDRIRNALAVPSRSVAVIGAPFAVQQLAAYADTQSPVDGGDRLLIVTGGGWKRQAASAPSKSDFRARMAQTFGISEPLHIRDAFNQVELNTVVFECEAHRMHLPPWLFAQARCARTLEPLPDGTIGLLSFVDLSATSYPAAIVGDDIGRIDRSPCTCGRSRPSIEIIRRVDRISQKGCALRLQQQVNQS